MIEIADFADMLYRYEASFDCGRPMCDDLEHVIDWIPHASAAYGCSFFAYCGFYIFKRRSCGGG